MTSPSPSGRPAPLLAAVVALLTLTLPRAAVACPVCFSGEDANRIAYIATTAFLTFIPLILVSVGVLMLRRHIVRKNAEVDEVGA